jgi:hypothetical protein
MGAIKPVGHLKTKTQVRQDRRALRDQYGNRMNLMDPEDVLSRRFTARPRVVKPRKQRSGLPRVYTQDPTKIRGPQAHRRRRYGPASLVRLSDVPNPQAPWPTLMFERDAPEDVWYVPCVTVPLYYFDERMMAKGLIRFHHPDTFTISGSDRIFKLVAREQCLRTAHHRYLVVEVREDLPYLGLP